jgi:tetratricopeptide (TPR) repeat protein
VNRSLAILAVLCAATPVVAQSKRYPPEPVDKDRDKAAQSGLWDSATNPAQKPYAALVAQARQAIEQRSPGSLADALVFLDDAIKLLPKNPEAYRLRGEAYFWQSSWAKCADDLRVAVLATRASDALDKKAMTDLQLRLGNCQARAGRLGDAERTLADASAAGTANGELLMRLGEVRIAMGKLDEAIGALTAALDTPDVPSAPTRFLLASAYDRARRPAEAVEIARAAAMYDRQLTTLENSPLPFLGPGESHYLLGLAYASLQESPRPEYALIHFRQYIKDAPDSPWRKRAEEHLRDLKTTLLPEALERAPGGGAAALDLDATTALVRRAMPAMRACMAKLPAVVIAVTVTRSGPSSDKPAPAVPGRGYPYRPRPAMPPPDRVDPTTEGQADAYLRADADAAQRCIEPIASRIPWPAVKEKDAWYRFVFRVVAP